MIFKVKKAQLLDLIKRVTELNFSGLGSGLLEEDWFEGFDNVFDHIVEAHADLKGGKVFVEDEYLVLEYSEEFVKKITDFYFGVLEDILPIGKKILDLYPKWEKGIEDISLFMMPSTDESDESSEGR